MNTSLIAFAVGLIASLGLTAPVRQLALRVGMVDRVVDPKQVVPEALQYAQGFAELPPRALAETRRIAREDLVELFLGAQREDSEELRRRWFSDETQHGLRALAAKLRKGASV